MYINNILYINIKCLGGNNIPTLTLSIPEELKKRMDKLPEVNWSEVLKNRLRKRAEALLKFEKIRKRGES